MNLLYLSYSRFMKVKIIMNVNRLDQRYRTGLCCIFTIFFATSIKVEVHGKWFSKTHQKIFWEKCKLSNQRFFSVAADRQLLSFFNDHGAD